MSVLKFGRSELGSEKGTVEIEYVLKSIGVGRAIVAIDQIWYFAGYFYQMFIDSRNSVVSAASSAGRGESLVTRCCGRVPATRAGMSASV